MSKASRARKAVKHGEGSGEEATEAEAPEATPEEVELILPTETDDGTEPPE